MGGGGPRVKAHLWLGEYHPAGLFSHQVPPHIPPGERMGPQFTPAESKVRPIFFSKISLCKDHHYYGQLQKQPLLPNQLAPYSMVAFVRRNTVYSKDRRMKVSARRLITFCLALLVIQVTDLSTPVPCQQGSMNFPEQELLSLSDHFCFLLTLSKDVECGVSLPVPTCHLSTYAGGVWSDLLYISELGYLLRFCIFWLTTLHWTHCRKSFLTVWNWNLPSPFLLQDTILPSQSILVNFTDATTRIFCVLIVLCCHLQVHCHVRGQWHLLSRCLLGISYLSLLCSCMKHLELMFVKNLRFE